jgi:hypothetical protein
MGGVNNNNTPFKPYGNFGYYRGTIGPYQRVANGFYRKGVNAPDEFIPDNGAVYQRGADGYYHYSGANGVAVNQSVPANQTQVYNPRQPNNAVQNAGAPNPNTTPNAITPNPNVVNPNANNAIGVNPGINNSAAR